MSMSKKRGMVIIFYINGNLVPVMWHGWLMADGTWADPSSLSYLHRSGGDGDVALR